MKKAIFIPIIVLLASIECHAKKTNSIAVAEGWANTSVNAAVFRKNSLVTHDDTQFTAFYDIDGYVVLAKRDINSTVWDVHRTQYRGRPNDAHNVISIMTDGDGYLHVAWDHHLDTLRYAVSKEPLSLELGDTRWMTGINENKVTYPEFYLMDDGGLLFIYRDGGSGNGNLVMNRYDLKTRRWSKLQENLIDGEGERNAYWQTAVDSQGVIHLSWVWRETGDVSTNHDLCYARSKDGGYTWEDSHGRPYTLPITIHNAETAVAIPQQSELINQTSMTCDNEGRPYIATYWREQDLDIPQYHIVYLDEHNKWQDINTGFRTTPFTLSGGGTKRILISRPQVVADISKKLRLILLFRDSERGDKVSAAICDNPQKGKWRIKDLTDYSVGLWEPTFDTELWKNENKLHVFTQSVEQMDEDKPVDIGPQMVYIIESE